jgi:flavin-dependent dehydrogenase
MKRISNRIGTGSRVAIVGGGAAGSFFALHLLRYARQEGILPEITIYESRDFHEPGPKGCKGCAGVLSFSLVDHLGEIGLSLPGEVIQRRIESYTVHSPYTSITLAKPKTSMQTYSVFRGAGPRLTHGVVIPGLNGWLLGQAEKHGAVVERERVTSIDIGPDAGVEVGGRTLTYDLVVLATGVNAASVKITGLDYVPPKTQIMAQDELFADAEEVESRLGGVAHAFLIPRSEVIFGTLVPKGSFINVSVLSQGEHPVPVKEFLEHDIAQQMLPERYMHSCGCRPKAAVGPAQNYYADRFVAVGDAAVTRLYKDGIGSSFLSARAAAQAVIHHGITRSDFARYYQPFCHSVDRDNRWGHRLFSLNDRVKDSRVLVLAQHRLIRDEQNKPEDSQPFTKAAWGMFSGSYNYRSIASMTLNPISLAKLLLAVCREGLKVLLGSVPRDSDRLRPTQ